MAILDFLRQHVLNPVENQVKYRAGVVGQNLAHSKQDFSNAGVNRYLPGQIANTAGTTAGGVVSGTANFGQSLGRDIALLGNIINSPGNFAQRYNAAQSVTPKIRPINIGSNLAITPGQQHFNQAGQFVGGGILPYLAIPEAKLAELLPGAVKAIPLVKPLVNAVGKGLNFSTINTLSAAGEGQNYDQTKQAAKSGFKTGLISDIVPQLNTSGNALVRAGKNVLGGTVAGLISGQKPLEAVQTGVFSGLGTQGKPSALQNELPAADKALQALQNKAFPEGGRPITFGLPGEATATSAFSVPKPKVPIHPQDIQEMVDFTDYATKPGVKHLDPQYEYNMRDMAAHYGINPNQGNKALANDFAKILDQTNIKNPDPNQLYDIPQSKNSPIPLFDKGKYAGSKSTNTKIQEAKSPTYAIGGGSGHTAPLPEGNAPAFDLTQLYPNDIYSNNADRLYSSGNPVADRKAIAILHDIKGNPNAEVTIYRAVPKNINVSSINPGDWVSLTEDYAIQHAKSNINGDYKILKQKVTASELYTDANSIQEFGYNPKRVGGNVVTSEFKVPQVPGEQASGLTLGKPSTPKGIKLQRQKELSLNRDNNQTIAPVASSLDQGIQATGPGLPGTIQRNQQLPSQFSYPDTSNLSPEVQATLNKTAVTGPKSISGAGSEAANLFGTGPGTADIQNSLRAAKGSFDLNKDALVRDSAPLIKGWDKVKPAGHLNFIQSIESGVPQPTPELQQLADNYRTRFNQDYLLAQSIKPDVAYRANYFSHNGIWSDSKAAEQFFNKWMTPSLGGKPGALEQRSFPTIYDGIKAGLGVKESNPEIIALNNRTQLLKAKMAQDFKEAQAAKGVDPALVNKVVDRYLETGISGSNVYKTIRDANSALNSMQLGLSAFHVSGTAINATVSKLGMAVNDLLTGHPIDMLKHIAQAPTASLEYVFRGHQILQDAKAGKLTPDIANIAGGGGRLQMPETYQTTGFGEALNTIKKGGVGNFFKGVYQTVPAILNNAAKPIMEFWVPRLKDGAAADLIATNLKHLGPNASEEAINAVRAKAIDSIDNRFGQLVQDNLFWNKTMKDLMGLGMRSPGWNIGTVRELGGGVKDWFNFKDIIQGKGVSDRAAYTMALPVVVGTMGAVYQYMHTGTMPQDAKDYFYPKTGQTDANGNPERVSFPTYAKDVYSFFHAPLQTVINKESPALNIASSLIKNRNYYGDLIRNPNDPAMTQAKQVTDYLGQTVLPFSLTGGAKRVVPDTTAKVENFAGITKAPGSVTQSATEKAIYGAMPPRAPRTPEQVQSDTQKADVRKQIQAGNTDSVQSLIDQGIITRKGAKTFIKNSQFNSLQRAYNSLPKAEQQKVLDSLDPKQKQSFLDQLLGKAQAADSTGVVSTSSINNPYNSIKDSSLASVQYQGDIAAAKRAGDVKGGLVAINNRITDLQSYQKTLNPKLDEASIVRTQNQIDSLQAQADKYKGYGGFTKPKKGKKLKVAKAKKLQIRSSSVTPARVKKVKVYRAKTISLPRAKAIRLSTPKGGTVGTRKLGLKRYPSPRVSAGLRKR